jgi:co-chaperonin GroES (HSP10)
MKMNEPVASGEAELAWAFPSVDPGAKPLGGRILVQLRRTKKRTTSAGIILVEETKETEKWNNMVAKVVAIGPWRLNTVTRCRHGLRVRGAR